MKTQVRAARHQLSIELRSRGAEVGFLEWNAEDGKGPDDLLANKGGDFVVAQIARVEFNTATGWKAKLLCTDTGKPKALLFNAIMALSEDPAFAGVLRFDEFALKTIVDKEPPWERQNRRNKIWTEDDDRQACAWLQAEGIEVKVSVANEAVQTVAMQHSSHPVLEYLDGLPRWDGEKRVDNWLTRYCGVKATKYSSKVGRYFLISAVARVMEPGCKVDYCLILEGNQGIGKSQVVGILGGPWATDDMPDLQDRDIKEHIVGLWIIELPELSSLGKSDVNRIKGS